MSLSIPSVALIRGATRLAGDVASRVGQAIGFDEVLRGPDTDPVQPGHASAPDVALLTKRLAAAIGPRLSDSGIVTNQSLRLSVNSEGSLRVEENHPRAAEIESLLNSDPAIVEAAGRLHRASGSSEISIDLTSPQVPANMVAPGGYPNW